MALSRLERLALKIHLVYRPDQDWSEEEWDATLNVAWRGKDDRHRADFPGISNAMRSAETAATELGPAAA
jgi:hypothetical protein